MKKIVLTGGGTGGHVIPALALVDTLKENDYKIYYIGSKNGIERELAKNLPYYPISTGKLRRYLDFKNITDMVRVIKGITEAISALGNIKPDIVFSKGGFVSVPVVIGAWLLKIPIIVHESDISFGLANKIGAHFAAHICVAFPELNGKNTTLTGTPIRKELFNGSKEIGLAYTSFTRNLPVLLVMGGSSGSVSINKTIKESLPLLLPNFNIIHICGKNNASNLKAEGYIQYEYINKQLANIFALCDVVISRSGANALQEFLALKKPNLLIPLPKNISRGDQIQNAQSYKKMGYSIVLEEHELTPEILLKKIIYLYENKNTYIENMEKNTLKDTIKEIVCIIKKYSK